MGLITRAEDVTCNMHKQALNSNRIPIQGLGFGFRAFGLEGLGKDARPCPGQNVEIPVHVDLRHDHAMSCFPEWHVDDLKLSCRLQAETTWPMVPACMCMHVCMYACM